MSDYNDGVDGIATEFFASLGTSYDTSCVNDLPIPDFDGSDPATQNISMEYFGNSDLWGNEKTFDEVVVPASDNSDCDFSQSDQMLRN